MATILDTLQKGTDYLGKHGVDEARLNMQHLIAHTLKCDRMQLYVDFDRELSEPQLTILRDLTRRRGQGEPLQHLLGTIEFCGLEFRCDDRALVPRQETEELAERISKSPPSPGARILDLGCGSGVIGLTLAHRLADGDQEITMADISPPALELTRENAAALGLSGRVRVVESDLFSHLQGPFDLVVANLPYVPESERTSLSREVLRDPDLALYGGADGMDVFREFFRQVGAHTAPGSRIALEFGIGQGDGLQRLAADAEFDQISIVKDISGTERFLFAVKS